MVHPWARATLQYMTCNRNPAISIDDVAARCGVAKSTVSKALSPRTEGARLADQTRVRIRAIAAELGYHPNQDIRLKARKKTGYLGLIYGGNVPLVAGVYEELTGVAAVAAHESGYRLVLLPGQGNASDWRKLLSNHCLDGALVVEPPPGLEDFLSEEALPTVILNETGTSSLPRVLVDDAAGARAMMSHLIGLGHRQISFCQHPLGPDFTSSQQHYSYKLRLDAYCLAMSEIGEKPNVRIGNSPAETAERLRLPLHESAILCASHLDALQVLSACRRIGVSLPQAASIACFNRVSAMDWAQPTLTAVRIPIDDLTFIGVSIVVDLIEGRSKALASPHLVQPTLVLGESTVTPAHVL